MRTLTTNLLTIGVFAAIGGLTGWVVGNSQSPVVAALLPLVFGLIGGLGVGFFEKRRNLKRLLEGLGDLDADDQAKLEPILAERSRAADPAPVWLLSLLAFCGCCFVGLRTGTEARVQLYPALRELLDEPPASAVDQARLYNLYWELQAAGVPRRHVVDLFDSLGQAQGDELAALIHTVRTGDVLDALPGAATTTGAVIDATGDRAIPAQPTRALRAILLEVIDIDDPVEVGGTTALVVTLTNQGTSQDSMIEVGWELDARLEFVSATGATDPVSEGDAFFKPLPALSPGQTATWRIVVRAVSAGEATSRFTMRSSSQTLPVTESERTYVYE